MPEPGERRVRKDGLAFAEWNGQEWIENPIPKGMAASQFEQAIPRAAADAPYTPLTPGADSRSRITLGLGPSVAAQRNLYASENWAPNARGERKPRNPYNEAPVATFLAGLDNGKLAEWTGFTADPLAKVIGGQDFQDYQQAAKSFESAFLPVLSGAAVTATEASRMIKASLPEMGDTPATLARKATNRAMMINGAADLAGRPRPFPQVGTWDFQGNRPGSTPRPGQKGPPSPATQSGPVKVRSVAEARALPPGTRFVTPDGRVKVR
jgi:hypothetical protein